MRIYLLENLWNQRMKYLNIDLIGIDNTAQPKYIVAMHGSMLPEIIMSIHEDDSESGVPREYELHVMIY